MTRFSKINKSKDEIDANDKVMGGICKREMLTNALRVLVKNSVKESFYGKRKKKQLMF